ncbi:hypothetical protein CTheo_3268 [Ceratobasidium theobromae]|uniref:Uncharacterized protein n=1 Tax=Ceratobasidium theobromae TaxID=1582974 RepID=A0A5N5QNA6_9AGAM|nr:hypothetical protein CTheo_3268 [Ceratobasidium theobromae]
MFTSLSPLPPDQPDAAEFSAAVPASLTIAQSTDTSQAESGLGTTPKDQLLAQIAQLAQLADQFAQNNSRTTELIAQLAEMSREVQGQKQLIEDKERRVRELEKLVEEKDAQLCAIVRLVQGGQSANQSQGGSGGTGILSEGDESGSPSLAC